MGGDVIVISVLEFFLWFYLFLVNFNILYGASNITKKGK
jgi:hypothetical protein